MKIFSVVLLTSFLISSCTSKEELSRDKASSLIKEAMKFPRVIDYDIYSSDPEFARIAIDKGIKKEGLITVQRTQK